MLKFALPLHSPATPSTAPAPVAPTAATPVPPPRNPARLIPPRSELRAAVPAPLRMAPRASAPVAVAPDGPNASDAQAGRPASASATFARRAEAGFSQPAAPAVAPVAPGTAAPLSGRVTLPASMAASQPAGKTARLRDRLLGRPVNLSSKIAGVGVSKSRERANALGLPPVAEQPAPSAEQLIASADAQIARAAQVLNTTLEQLADINQRPARSAGREKLMATWPLNQLKAKKLSDVLQQDPALALPRGMPATTAVQQAGPLAVLRKIAAGKAALDRARLDYVALQQRPQASAAQQAQAAAVLHQASQDLQAAVTVNSWLGANDDVLTSEVVQQRAHLLQLQLADLEDRLGQTSAGSAERVAAVSAKLDVLRGLVRDARGSLACAEGQLGAMSVLVGQLRSQANSALEPGAAALVQAQLDLLDSAMPDTEAAAKRAAQALAAARAQMAVTLPDYERERTLQKKLDGSLDKVRAASQPVRDKTTQLQARSQLAAHAEQQNLARALDLLVEVAPGFSAPALAGPGGAGLADCLRQIAANLPEDDPQAEHGVPRLAAIEIISRAVAGAVDGDVAAAVALLNQLMAQPSSHWCPLPGQPATAPQAVQQLFRRMAQVPRGTELLDRIGARDGRPTLGRDQREAMQTYWMIAQAQADESDPAVHAWLDDAKAVASQAIRFDKKAAAAANVGNDSSSNAGIDSASNDSASNYSASNYSASNDSNASSEGDVALPDMSELPLAQRVAHGAASRGMLSNATGSEFDRINQALLKVGDQFVEMAKDERNKLQRFFTPSKARTPFHPKTLQVAIKQLEAQGMPSVKSTAHVGIAQVAAGLSAKLAAGGLRGLAGEAGDHAAGREALHFDVTAQVLCDYIARQQDGTSAALPDGASAARTNFTRSKRLYKAQLGPKDFALIRREVAQRLAEVTTPAAETAPAGQNTGMRARLHKLGAHFHTRPGAAASQPNPGPGALSTTLPAPFEALFAQTALAPLDAVRAITKHLDVHLSAQDKQRLDLTSLHADIGLDKIDHTVDIARRKRFETKQQVLDFYAPMLRDLRLRNQLIMTSGDEIGANLPMLPWAPVAPFMANVIVNLFSRKHEASFQVKSPTYGVEFIIADTVTDAHDIKATAGIGLDLGVFKLTLPSFSLRGDTSHAKTEYALLRVLRNKDDQGMREEQVARDDGLALLDTLLRWDAADKQVPGQPPFAGPLEAILALHPDVVIGSGSKDNRTHGINADLALAARVPFAGGHLNAGIGITPLGVRAEITKEQGNERSGYQHQLTVDNSDQRKQKATFSTSTGGILTLVREALGAMENGEADASGSGRWLAGINLLDMSRELAYNSEKNGVTRFSMGDKVGFSVDRVYGTPKDLLAEIERNKEDFLLRFLETIPLAEGVERNTPANRALAASALEQFMDDLKHSKKHAMLQFNIKFELQPKMSGWVGALEALEALAHNAGDNAAALEYRQAKAELMSYRSSWSFKNCAIRSKHKDSDDEGVDYVLRLLAKHSAESSAAITAFPG